MIETGRCIFLAGLMALVPGSAAYAAGGTGPQRLDEGAEVAPFAAEMASRHGLDADATARVLRQARVIPEIIERISRPAEGLPWHRYRRIFLTAERAQGGVAFARRHADTLAGAYRRYGVPPEVVTAIIGVETYYGRHRGTHRVLDALATLGFRYPRRGEFFRRELGEFLVLADREGLDPLALRGSYAGAMGVPQFIPSSYRAYAVDFDGDGVRDLLGSTADAIGSVAAYLAAHGWTRDAPVAFPVTVPGEEWDALVGAGEKPWVDADGLARRGVSVEGALPPGAQAALIELQGEGGAERWAVLDNFRVITRYNHSKLYAMAVWRLSGRIAAGVAGGGGG